MAEIIPVDEFLEWYPGWTPGLTEEPWVAARPGPFTKDDESKFWFADFHWPRGFSPIGFLYVTDCSTWGTQLAAHNLPLPPGRGLVQRMGGPFLYESEVPVTSEWEIGFRAARIERTMPAFLGNFDAIWEERKWELELGLAHFEGQDLAGTSLPEIGQFMADARAFHRRAWEIHFELMYPLLAIYLQLYGHCAANGLDPAELSKMLQGRDSRIMETDRAMWGLVAEAKRLGIADTFTAHPPEGLRDALSAQGGNAATWLTKFDDFLQKYGWRTEGIADVNLPSWIENPTSPLGQIRNFLEMDEPHDFERALAGAREERDEAIESARSQLSGEALDGFNGLLDICSVANFAWWNEDHNYYIDLRATIPLRRAALALGEAVGADRYDDALFLFYPEFMNVARGDASWSSLQSVATDRHQYYDHYNEIRPTLPKVVGTLPDKVDDPVLIEIFGMHHHFFEGLRSDADATVLTGFPASAGTVKGRARVMVSADALFELEEDEILVCEATSPNWTPAFALIAGCVCDGGGSLTHAAIVSREYGIPCVVGTSVATSRIGTGDLLEIDGTKGVVTILERAAPA
jgi:phosphohistidine swiveling domain-containing protein